MESKYRVRELTPEANMCLSPGCPGIYELTSESMKCGPIGGCPTIEEYKEKYLIVGKVEDFSKFPTLEGRVGEGEILISVPKGIIDGMKR